jgi:pyridoxine 5-phosphate synthase
MNPLNLAAQTTHLSVNLNKVALMRNSRHLGIPSVTHFAQVCIDAGAQGITIHPRPDERHIRASDVPALAELLKSQPHIEFNIEGNPFHNLMPYLRDPHTRPHQVTFVPDSEGQFTSDHGWSFPLDLSRLKPLVQEAKDLGVRVSLFMDPLPDQVELCKETGADRIELYTEQYAKDHGGTNHAKTLASYVKSAQAALSVGLGINAGHDLNLANLADFLHAVPGVQEVSIGHAITADALEYGFAGAVQRYLAEIAKAYAK